MTETNQQLATEIDRATRELNQKFQEAERLGLHVVAKVNEFLNLADHLSGKRVRIEVALLQPITPQEPNRR